MCTCSNDQPCSCKEEDENYFCVDSIDVTGDLKINSNGFLIAPVILAEAGTSIYKDSEIPQKILAKLPKKKNYTVLKSEDTLAQDSVIASFENVPIVDEHPSGSITVSDKRGKNTYGFIRDVRFDGKIKKLVGNAVFTTMQAISTIQEKKKVSIGFGYDYVLSDKEGIDFEQRSIRGNHVALTNSPRCATCQIIGLDSSNSEKEENMEAVQPTIQEANPVIHRVEPSYIEWNGRKIHPDEIGKVIEEEKHKALSEQESKLREQITMESQEKISVIEKAKDMTGSHVDVDTDVDSIKATAIDSVMRDNDAVQNIVKEICGSDGIRTKNPEKLNQAFTAIYAVRDLWKKKPMAKDSGQNVKAVFEGFGKSENTNKKEDYDMAMFLAKKAQFAYQNAGKNIDGRKGI